MKTNPLPSYYQPIIHSIMDNKASEVLTPEVLNFLCELHLKFNETRLHLLRKRVDTELKIISGDMPNFLPETKKIRDDKFWKVEPVRNKVKIYISLLQYKCISNQLLL